MAPIGGPVLLVGCGAMGAALMTAWLAPAHSLDSAIIVDPQPSAAIERLRADRRVSYVASADRLPAGCAPCAIILAVKPQIMAATAPAYRGLVERGALAISIAAGTSLASLSGWLGGRCARAMPNLPAAVGRGVTILCAGILSADRLDGAERALAERLFAAVGETLWVEDEAMIDLATGLSGCGPAYVFRVTEALESAGRRLGLADELARRLARATVVGAAALLDASGEEPAALRARVTSPGGATAAALAALDRGDALQRLFDDALAAAAARAQALAAEQASG